jgi:hypothetical protein
LIFLIFNNLRILGLINTKPPWCTFLYSRISNGTKNTRGGCHNLGDPNVTNETNKLFSLIHHISFEKYFFTTKPF